MKIFLKIIKFTFLCTLICYLSGPLQIQKTPVRHHATIALVAEGWFYIETAFH